MPAVNTPAGARLRPFEPPADQRFLASLWAETVNAAWPVLPTSIEDLREGLVAEVASAIVGVAARSGQALQFLVVSPAWRRRGIGSELLLHMREQARQEGHRILGLGSGGEKYVWPGVAHGLRRCRGVLRASQLLLVLRSHRPDNFHAELAPAEGGRGRGGRHPGRDQQSGRSHVGGPRVRGRAFPKLGAAIRAACRRNRLETWRRDVWSAPCCGRRPAHPTARYWRHRAVGSAASALSRQRGVKELPRPWCSLPLETCGLLAPLRATSAGPGRRVSTSAAVIRPGGVT